MVVCIYRQIRLYIIFADYTTTATATNGQFVRVSNTWSAFDELLKR